jgi:hemolysin activation/secretion protein
MKRSFFLKTSTFLFTSLLPVAAFATSVNVPSVAQPSRVGESLRIENIRPDVSGVSTVTVPNESGSKPLKEGAKFKLNSITVENATAFSKADLEEDYKDLIGQSVSLNTLNQVTAKLTARYRNNGYILSRAVLPPQRINGGAVKIRIVEGFVDSVKFEGAENSGLLSEYAEKIRTAKPLDAATLERYLLLIEDLPGVKAQAVLKPSAKVPGASDVIISITQKMVDGSVTADNRGSRFIGPYQGSLTANVNNVLGMYERTQFRAVSAANPEEQTFFQVSHEQQLDSEGTKLNISAGKARTQPGYRVKAFEIKGVDTTYSAALSHPFIRSRQTNLFGTAQFDIRNTDTKALGTELNGDRLRVARVGASYDFLDGFQAINRAEAQVSKGFGWLDNTSPDVRSRVNGRTSFYKGTAQASRLQSLTGPFSVFVAAKGQVASAALLSAEQFGLGGADFGSAYDPSEITGDAGIAGRGELQFSHSNDANLIPSYQLYSFYDIGRVSRRNPAAGTKSVESLASAGFGTRFNLMDPISGNLELAIPVTRPVSANNAQGHGNAARLFFSLAYRY